MPSPYTQDGNVLIPETCEYVTLPGQKDFVYAIKDLDIAYYHELWVRSNVITSILIRGRQEG